MIEYSSDSSSPCFWLSFNAGSCLTQVKNYAVSLNMVPQLTSVNVSVDLLACQSSLPGRATRSPCPLPRSFSEVSTGNLNIGPFNITASSTAQFVQPPVSAATPTPTPTSTGAEAAPTGVTVWPTSGCTSNCQEFSISWTPPSNVDAIGHYEIAYGSSGSYTYAGPEPGAINGNATASSRSTFPIRRTPNASRSLQFTPTALNSPRPATGTTPA